MNWFEKIKLSHRLKLSLACFFVLIVGMGVFSLRQLDSINRKVVDISSNWMPAVYSVAAMRNAFNEYRVAVLQHTLASQTGDSAELAYAEEQLQKRLEVYRKYEAAYVSLIANNQERTLYDSSRKIFESYLSLHQQILDFNRQHRTDEAIRLMRGKIRGEKDVFNQAMDALGQFQFDGGRDTATASTALLHSSRGQTYVLLALLVLFELLALYVVGKFCKSMTFLQRAGVNTCSSVNQLAAVIQQQEAAIGQQATSSTEIVASAKEISATAKALSGNMDDIAHIANETRHKAIEGQQSLAVLDDTMRRMVEASNTITSKLAVLSERAGNITSVLNLIIKIADQTNLLSLNAAIEAEKAGEYGLGFAVVATEIRRLSDQTSVATFDIEQILKEMQSSVSVSVMGMDKFADEIRRNADEVGNISRQLTDITEQIKALSPRFDVIYEGMQAQNLGTEQITEAMTQFNEGLHQTAQSIRNSRQTVTLLNEASQDLQRGVNALG